MHGSAMFVVNPPWTLKAALDESLPWLKDVLAVDEKAAWETQASASGSAKDVSDR
jgi:23S rRNA (adenine2030-N6)-methyltransferase